MQNATTMFDLVSERPTAMSFDTISLCLSKIAFPISLVVEFCSRNQGASRADPRTTTIVADFHRCSQHGAMHLKARSPRRYQSLTRCWVTLISCVQRRKAPVDLVFA